MSLASDNRSDKHTRKCAQIYKHKDSADRAKDGGEGGGGEGNRVMESTRDNIIEQKLEKLFFSYNQNI